MTATEGRPKRIIDIVNECDGCPSGSAGELGIYTFFLDGVKLPLGYMIESIVRAFKWPKGWQIDHGAQTVTLSAASFEARNALMHSTLQAERERSTFKLLNKWTEELVPVYGPQGNLVLSMERAAAPLFGIVTFGVQLLAYERNQEGISGVWISRRAKDKRTFPGMLDCTAGGGLVTGETPFESLLREAVEEASLSEKVVKAGAKACGAVSYIMVSDERLGGEVGLLRPGIQYVYEIQLPPNVIPSPGDGEAEEIQLLNVQQLRTALEDGRFSPGHAYVLLDFLIRHGIVTADSEEHYLEAVSRLHRRLPFSTPLASSFKRQVG